MGNFFIHQSYLKLQEKVYCEKCKSIENYLLLLYF